MSETVLIVLALIIAVGVVAILVLLLKPRATPVDLGAERRIAELAGHVQALQQAVHQTSQNLGQSMQTSTKHTVENLQKLNERLAVIDNAQKNITDLATQVNSLHSVLANKQSRGAFGQGQLEAIITDALPKGAFEFQFTLSNKTRPDCAIFMPDSGPLVIDAKFPLEAMTAWRSAANDEERKVAVARVKQDIAKHVADIADKYLIPGETQDIALMFIPSESVYADLHERFDDVVQRAHRARVMIVSPTLMVMAIQVIKQVRKDAAMRVAADQIRDEIGHMMKDVGLLSDRVRKLQTHFGQANTDIDAILTSTGKIEKRGAKIESLDFDESRTADILPGPGARKLEAGE